MSDWYLVEVACLTSLTLARDIIKNCADFLHIMLEAYEIQIEKNILTMVSRPSTINKIGGGGLLSK